jgi:hypothetical protein
METYDKDIRIDETALDIELLNQSQLVSKYGFQLAEARLNLELKKENLEITRAELDTKIRRDPDKFEINKITETVISNTIINSEQYQIANKQYLKAKFDVDANKVALDAIQAKGDSLTNLVRLHGQQYFAGPTIPRDIQKERVESEKELNQGISQKLNKSKRTKF